MDSGIYIAVFRLTRPCEVRVGRLGCCSLKRGVYLYVGSAQKNLAARLARHKRRDKPLRWHIDYLSAQAEMLGAMIVPAAKSRECEVAGQLARWFDLAVRRFGSSDCNCPGHLFYSNDLVEVCHG